MALTAVPLDILERITKSLGMESLNRPHAVLVDPGDFGTVFTYLPLLAEEYQKLPPDLQKYVYVVSRNRYGLVGFVPKNFELPGKIPVVSITAVYGPGGGLAEMTYLAEGEAHHRPVCHSIRREKLLELAKKKKIPVKTVIRAS